MPLLEEDQLIMDVEMTSVGCFYEGLVSGGKYDLTGVFKGLEVLSD